MTHLNPYSNGNGNPNLRSTAITTIISVGLTLVVILSTWLISGRSWLKDSGATEQQIKINTVRLDKIESEIQQPNMFASKTSHDELVDRVSKLEGSTLTRAESQQLDRARDEILRSLKDEITDLRADIRALQLEIRQHDADARKYEEKK